VVHIAPAGGEQNTVLPLVIMFGDFSLAMIRGSPGLSYGWIVWFKLVWIAVSLYGPGVISRDGWDRDGDRGEPTRQAYRAHKSDIYHPLVAKTCGAEIDVNLVWLDQMAPCSRV